MVQTPSQHVLEIHSELARINLALLMLAQTIARRSLGEAALRFGIDTDVLRGLAEASPGVLQALAGSERLCVNLTVSMDDINAAKSLVDAKGV